MGNNSVPKFIFRLSRFPVYRGSVLGRFYCTSKCMFWHNVRFFLPPRRPEDRLCLKCDGTRAETRFRLSAKRTSPFKSAGASFQSTSGSRGVRISGSNAGYTLFRGSMRVLATHSICQFPLHFPSRASPCAITFQLDSSISCLPSQQLQHCA